MRSVGGLQQWDPTTAVLEIAIHQPIFRRTLVFTRTGTIGSRWRQTAGCLQHKCSFLLMHLAVIGLTCFVVRCPKGLPFSAHVLKRNGTMRIGTPMQISRKPVLSRIERETESTLERVDEVPR